VDKFEGACSMLRVFSESSIGHFSKSTSRTYRIFCRKINGREVLSMFSRMSQHFLRRVHEAVVHKLIINRIYTHLEFLCP
jgi:hypothetical protein